MARIGRLLGLIAAKGSSERVAAKNVRAFADSSLLEVKLKQVRQVAGIDEIVVSSEDGRVLEIAQSMGVSIHERDPHYSKPDVPMSEVYTHLASEFDHDTILWIPVTNPLAGPDVYRDGIQAYLDMSDEFDCLLSVREVKEYIFYQAKPVNFRPNPWPRSQDLEGLLAISFVVNILRREDMMRWGSLVGDKPYFHILDSMTSMDIDVQEDFDFCEFLYKRRFMGAR